MRNKRLLIAFLAAAILVGASSLIEARAQDPLPDAATAFARDVGHQFRRARSLAQRQSVRSAAPPSLHL